ncbi:MAG: hypothetical protein WBQ29_03995 [Isosphaeraceae bacterium]
MLQFRFWQFGLLVALTAIAIVDIQGYCREPRLIALASAGYVGYALLCWLLWHAIRRFESWLGSVLVVAVYAVAMGGCSWRPPSRFWSSGISISVGSCSDRDVSLPPVNRTRDEVRSRSAIVPQARLPAVRQEECQGAY